MLRRGVATVSVCPPPRLPMSKSRFTSLDVRCAVADVRRKVLGLRVANVYDLSAKAYLFKLVKPDVKAFLVLESGLRFHCTQYSRDKRDVPSIFAMKVALAPSPPDVLPRLMKTFSYVNTFVQSALRQWSSTAWTAWSTSPLAPAKPPATSSLSSTRPYARLTQFLST